ncbi:MAG: HD domain-containing protein [Anaerolineae bacterium]|nr:HD domain-containing protein [Anaerolineae bacterium]
MADLNAVPAPIYIEWHRLIAALQTLLGGYPQPIYLVGGVVRDALLRRASHDLDFVCIGDGRKPAKRIADHFGGAYYPLDSEREIGRAIIEFEGERFVLDVSRARGATLLDDLTGRDFTINALAVPLEGEMQTIIDPLGGISDVMKKIIRRCSPTAIADDPIRALRGVRQSTSFQMQIEPQTRKDIREYGVNIAHSSVERVRDELINLLNGPRPHAALRTLDLLGLLKLILPEVDTMRGVTQSLPHVFDVWEHTLNVVEQLDGILHTISPYRTSESAGNTADGMIVYLLDQYRRQLQDHLATPLPNGRSVRALLMLAALLHDCGKPATRTVGDDGRIHFYKHELEGAQIADQRATALRLSTEEVSRLSAIVRHHMRPVHLEDALSAKGELSRRSIFRYWNATGLAGVDVCILTLADYLGTVGAHMNLQDWIQRIQTVSPLLEGYFLKRAEIVAPTPLISGNDLMQELALAPGPQIGQLLRSIQEAQASGEILTREQALEFARQLLHSGTSADSDDSDAE